MASTYSALKIELIGTGDQTGTWGATTNVNLGDSALGEAITGSADVAFSSADVTITLTDTNTTQSARNLRLNLTGTSGGARNLILGSGCQIEKLYLVNNGLADAVTVKNTTGTGIAVPAGTSMFVYNNGTNVVVATTAVTTLTNSALTSGRVTYAGASGLLSDSANLAWDNTNVRLGVGTSSPAAPLDIGGNPTYQNQMIWSRGVNDTDFKAVLASGDTGTQASIGSIGVRYSSFKDFASIQFYRNSTVGNILFFTGGLAGDGTEKMRLDGSGNLLLSGTVAATTTGGMTITNTSSGSSSTPLALRNAGTANGSGVQISFRGVTNASAENDYAYFNMVADDTTAKTGSMRFSTANGSSPVERMRIDSSGNVGINTSNPDYGSYGATEKILGVTGVATYRGRLSLQNTSTGTTGAAGTVAFFNGSTLLGAIDVVADGATNKGLFDFNTNNGTTTTSRMRIDSSGNVGIGTSSPAATLHVQGNELVQNTAASLQINSTTAAQAAYLLLSNSTDSSNSYIYCPNKAIGIVQQDTSASSYVYFSTQNVERMRIDSGGNVGIGTSSQNYQLHVTTSMAVGASGFNQQLSFTNDTIQSLILGTGYTNLKLNPLGGSLLLGTTTQRNAAKFTFEYNGSTNNGLAIMETAVASGTEFITFLNPAATSIGNITRVGVTNAVVYNTTSDYRLKTVTGTVTGQGERIDALKPIDYQWKEGNQQARGFLAHEFQTVYPNSVSGNKDAVDADGKPVYQGMQASTAEVIADLVAEIQSLRQRITTLENK